MITIRLKERKDESLLRFHPWVFSGAIAHVDGRPNEGDVVRVVDVRNNFLAIGHYQVGSITVRVLSFEDSVIDRDFYRRRLAEAIALRRALGLFGSSTTDTYRLVHGEGDHLPGLIVDVYAKTAIVQAHSVGMHEARHILAELLVELLPDVENVYYKSETTLPFKAPISPEDGYLIGAESDSIAQENGLRFYADWIRGQKTGFFVDQRDNRSLLERYSQGKSVLNMFCYTGGFSFYAMRGGARTVHSVDSSAKAIDLTRKNIALNFGDDARHKAFTDDAFRYLDQTAESYDLMILDPPAFAKHRDAVKNALQGYKRLNAKAFEKIESGGILFTFSCSQVVSREQFRLAVFSAAAIARRRVRILHQLTQPADHPINIYHPEGEYLKGLVVYVE